ncbi:Carboxypeptidase D [Dirofilaria immitis]|nr:Carboxypeptidase D [Dirofilaria immitis]
MSIQIIHIFSVIVYFAICELDTIKIIGELENGNTVENYTTIMQRIGPFNETMQIKVRTNEEILDELTKLHQKYPHITYLYEIGKSVRGKPLMVLAIGKFPRSMLRAYQNLNMLLISMVMRENEVLTRLVNRTRIHLLPTMNPDGFAEAIPGSYGWLQQTLLEWSNECCRCGLKSGFPQRLKPTVIRNVQPETSAIMQWTKAIPFVLSANLHDGTMVVNFPYDDAKVEGIEARTGDHELFVMLSYFYARAHKFMWKKGPRCINQHDDDDLNEGITNGNKWYRVTGGMQDWNYVFANCFELTIEMNCVHNTISGFVLDGITGAGIPNVQISIDNVGKTVLSGSDGDFWRLVIPGTYNDNIMEVYRKLSNIEEQIWDKLIVMERNIRSAKAYLRSRIITIDGSEAEFDGIRIGLQRFENSYRDDDTIRAFEIFQKGVKIKIDDFGNVWFKCTEGNIFVNEMLGEVIVKNDPIKIFDLKILKEFVLRHDDFDDAARDRYSRMAITYAHIDKSTDSLSSALWFAVIHLTALEMIQILFPSHAATNVLSPLINTELHSINHFDGYSQSSSANTNCTGRTVSSISSGSSYYSGINSEYWNRQSRLRGGAYKKINRESHIYSSPRNTINPAQEQQKEKGRSLFDLSELDRLHNPTYSRKDGENRGPSGHKRLNHFIQMPASPLASYYPSNVNWRSRSEMSLCCERL